MKLTSDFALLDVKKGRKALAKHFSDKKGPIPVVIHAELIRRFGDDDGTSIEFEMKVTHLEVFDVEEKEKKP